MFCATGCSVNPDSVIERLKKRVISSCWLLAVCRESESLCVFVSVSRQHVHLPVPGLHGLPELGRRVRQSGRLVGPGDRRKHRRWQ